MQTKLFAFHGDKLRLARLTNGLSLDELGSQVAASRQYMHQLETGAKEPAPDMTRALAAVLRVQETFFSTPAVNPVREEDCHFRKLFTAPRAVMAQAAARGTLVEMLVAELDRRLKLPPVNFPSPAAPLERLEDVELVAEAARAHWGLGLDGPIVNMTRVVENAGAVVVHFDDICERIDALSIARRRPIIVRSSAKTAAVRLRFDLAHECGHLVMHAGVVTGDHETEDQANRFASAFLLPRRAFAAEFPRGRKLDWTAMYRLKLRWKVSVRAIVRRAYDLGLIDAAQYRTANVHMTKSGWAKQERYDDTMEAEPAELLHTALSALDRHDPAALHEIADSLGLLPALFEVTAGYPLAASPVPSNIVRWPGSGKTA